MLELGVRIRVKVRVVVRVKDAGFETLGCENFRVQNVWKTLLQHT